MFKMGRSLLSYASTHGIPRDKWVVTSDEAIGYPNLDRATSAGRAIEQLQTLRTMV